jgi:hypothetical protein
MSPQELLVLVALAVLWSVVCLAIGLVAGVWAAQKRHDPVFAERLSEQFLRLARQCSAAGFAARDPVSARIFTSGALNEAIAAAEAQTESHAAGPPDDDLPSDDPGDSPVDYVGGPPQGAIAHDAALRAILAEAGVSQ